MSLDLRSTFVRLGVYCIRFSRYGFSRKSRNVLFLRSKSIRRAEIVNEKLRFINSIATENVAITHSSTHRIFNVSTDKNAK